MTNKLTLHGINLNSTPKKLLTNEINNIQKPGRPKALKPTLERVQIYLESIIVDELKKEWKTTGIKGFSSFLVWKMQQKGVFKTLENSNKV